MRECVSFHIGGCGSQIGSACWDLLRTEHQISNTGSLLANNNLINHFPFFEEVRTKYVPRALFIDTEPLVLDEIRRNDDGVFFHPDRLINANEDAANNFARGFFRLTRELENIVENISRRTLETCDNLQGFLVYHSLGGGTGSGYTPNLLKKLSDDNPKKCILNMAIYPSSKTSNAIVEPYNTLFGLQHISESSDCLILFDNHSMHKVCHSKLRIRSPHYADLNNLLAQVMASMTCSLRSPGTLNVDLAEFPTNLVPFQQLKFSVPSLAPIICSNISNYQKLSISNLTNACCSHTNKFFNNHKEDNLYMSCCFIYRGDVAHRDIFNSLNELKTKNKIKLCKWISTGFKVGVNASKPAIPSNFNMNPVEQSMCMISNSTTVIQPFIKTTDDFLAMFKKSAFVHWYQGEGLETGEFDEAISYMCDVIEEYNKVIEE